MRLFDDYYMIIYFNKEVPNALITTEDKAGRKGLKAKDMEGEA